MANDESGEGYSTNSVGKEKEVIKADEEADEFEFQ